MAYGIPFSNDLITTTVTSCPNKVSAWIKGVKLPSDSEQSLIVGLDTEWRPLKLGHNVAVLQLCVGERCLVYRIFRSREIPYALAEFLSDGRNIFVGVGVKRDLQKLEHDYKIGGAARYEDLVDMAVRVYKDDQLKNTGLRKLASMELGVEMKKDMTRSRWDGRLSRNQIRYACHDAVASFQIGRDLRKKLQESSAASSGDRIGRDLRRKLQESSAASSGVNVWRQNNFSRAVWNRIS